MIMAIFDKYITRKSIHVILQNFERYLKREICVSTRLNGFLSNTIRYQPPFSLCMVYHNDIYLLHLNQKYFSACPFSCILM